MMLKANPWGRKIRLTQTIAISLLSAIVSVMAGIQAHAQPGQAGIKLSPGFSPNPIEVRGSGGGSASVQDVVGHGDSPTGQCTGYTNKQANQTIVLTEFFDSLSLEVESSEDTALTIQGPGGVWCNDDFNGNNPGVSGQWLAGTYKIWISSYAKDRNPAYVLRIRETR